MQIIGFFLLLCVVAFGFMDRGPMKVSTFDWHALTMILVGCLSAVLLGSTSETAKRTFAVLKELLPGMRSMSKATAEMDKEREEIYSLWKEGKRAQALEVAQRSKYQSTQELLNLVLRRAREASAEKVFTELRHEEINHWQPALNNWELLAKLGPSFGMVGTITGMIQLFKTFGAQDSNIGAAMSLALLATLYGVAFGAGIAGPIGHYLNGLLEDRLGVLERCEKCVNDLVASVEV